MNHNQVTCVKIEKLVSDYIADQKLPHKIMLAFCAVVPLFDLKNVQLMADIVDTNHAAGYLVTEHIPIEQDPERTIRLAVRKGKEMVDTLVRTAWNLHGKDST